MFDGAKLDKKIETTKIFHEKLITLYKLFVFLYKSAGVNTTCAICVPQFW
jgi:hypothetical protein